MRKAAEDAFSFNRPVPILLSTHNRNYTAFANMYGHLLPATNTPVPLWMKTDFYIETLVSIIHAL